MVILAVSLFILFLSTLWAGSKVVKLAKVNRSVSQ